MKKYLFVFMAVAALLYFPVSRTQATSITFTSDGVIQEPDEYWDVRIYNDATVDMLGGTVVNGGAKVSHLAGGVKVYHCN